MKKKKMILSAVLLASTLSITGMPNVLHKSDQIVHAAEVQQNSEILVSNFQIQAAHLEAYNQAFKVPQTSILSIKNNGGTYGNSVITNAIDGNLTTHWETSRPNSTTFKNQFEVTFKEPQAINRMTYATRQDGAKGKGYPKAFEIYASQSDSGDDYKLVGIGSHSTVSGNVMEYKFNEVTAKRVKFVFKEAHQDWASAAEVAFYKTDILTDSISKIFIDLTNTKLSAEYNSEKAISELEKLLPNHPMKTAYEQTLRTAREILNNPELSKEYENSIITLEQLGDPRHDAWSVKQQCYQLGSFLPTGLYYKPGETFIINADVAEGDPLPSIVFDQNWNIKGQRSTSYSLKRGLNTITAPVNSYSGGVYFINESTPNQQKYAPRISIKSGGETYPIYYSGKTNAEEYKQQLTEYKQQLDKLNVDGNIVVPNLATIVTDHTLITGKATDAYNSFIKGSTEPQAAANAWEDMMLYDYKLLGYSEDSLDPKHQIPKNRLHARAVTDGMYAGGGLIGIGYDAESVLFGTDLGWGVFHEAGHVVEMGPLRFLELTNNIFSLANQERTNQSIRIETDSIFNNLFNYYTSGKTLGFTYQKRPDSEVNVGGWEAHLIMWQLRIAFGYDFYTDIFKTGRDTNFTAGNTPGDRWARLGSDAAGYDLGAYLHRMGINLTDETLAYTAKYKKLDLAIQYADTNARLYKGTGFAEGYTSKIKSVEKVNGSVKITVDSNGVENDMMGFEIYRDGKLIGYTNKNSYIDNTVGDAANLSYQIKAFDRKLKAAEMSSVASINLHVPVIISNVPVLTLKQNQVFQPLDYVTAVSYNGQDLTSRLKVINNTVNTAKMGDYSITYEITDAAGNNQVYTLPVKVAANFTYASDLQWKTVTNTYLKTQNDKTIHGQTIKLNNGYNTVSYAKGIGTHATSTIVYDVTGKNYDLFESAVGVEQNIVNNSSSSIVFQVFVDGVEKYDSGLMKYTTPQKFVQVDITGANEVKLVLTDSGNGNSYDHGAWADAKFIVTDDTPQEVKNLQALLDFTKPITNLSYVNPALSAREIRLSNVMMTRAEIEKKFLADELTLEQINIVTETLTNFVTDIGQTYQAGGQPITFN
ncbi:NPCBM/NEW2 domain-containing protein [Metabacillus fastidiosus]|uniref:NPCBM/NEW2 domain-containing protein n=1 Tax=Metabacillus fastidiosus TaxID=1458 RepID=UPI000825FA84|nr:NPCBM/NEW2 domain-containing protein [Metabacillus fastidiosus]MED4464087.1 NPCBM/NEW2 domain-containing protein [Metabacillus fastidiosus]